ncbi:MAG TPA: DNA polymerase I [Clostridiales bacterium]|nr:DNA polymerase I [Clostridiales bacterium]
MKRMLVIDGNSILNRAFYGVRPLTTKDGFPTNALYGLVNMVRKQTEAIGADGLAVAFDLKAPTFRHRMYDAYKAGRRPMPEELAQQLPIAKELLAAMGFHVLELEGYEADDILGTVSAMCDEAGIPCRLMTGDRDSLQLISDNTHILLATNTETVDTDRIAFREKYGVDPEQFVDVKALMGDSSDNIPGVPGIGEKTALKLIATYGSLDGVYEALPTAKETPSVLRKLTEGRESAYLSQTLARICRTVPLGVELDGLDAVGEDRAKLRELFLRLEFSGFLKRFGLDAPDAQPQAEAVVAPIAVVDADAAAVAAGLEPCPTVALDCTENGLLLAGDTETVYRLTEPFAALVPALAGKTLVCHDSKALYKDPRLGGLRDLTVRDLMLAGYLANSSKGDYDLPMLVQDYLGTLLPQERPRVTVFLPLWEKLSENLEKSGQTDLLTDIEGPLAPVLADMETVGFRIDRAGIAAYGEQLGEVAAELEKQIYMLAGVAEFNINSPKQLGDILFEVLKLPHGKKTKTGYSTNAEILEKLRPYHPIVDAVLDYRQLTKLKSTYADGLLKVADENGRVHTTFKQTGTATGRLSSTEPNLQNIPVRTELGRELRRYFLPENRDCVIVDADYSQIELRLLAAISGDENLCEAFREGADIHTSTAAAVFGVPREAVTPEMRKKAKAVNFGIMYGIGAFSLADDIGVSRQQAQEFIDRYLGQFPKIDEYLKRTIAEAYENGYVTTLFGRRRYIAELAGKNKMQQKFGERVAMNSPIQGTAADLIKIAMVRVHNRLKREGLQARLILQVHDELLIEAKRDCAEKAMEILREEMENAATLAVPLTVEIHAGDNWFEAK